MTPPRPFVRACSRALRIGLWLSFSLVAATGWAQTTLSGKVTDPQGEVLVGANVYLLNTLDGASTDAEGRFAFQTEEQGAQVLVVSSLGFETLNLPVQLTDGTQEIPVKLRESVNSLNEVVIAAGSFEANSDGKVALMRPLDIASTAGAGADIAAAIQTLPGTQRTGDQTGLFVRGGDASESLTIIDGMVVQNAFQSNVPGVAQRSRFSPFQFKGISFSSGGYSARYGQALSSVLELSTLDLPEESTVSFGLNQAGLSASAAKLWENQAVEVTAGYTNLAPFLKVIPTNFDFYKIPQGGNGSARWLWKRGDTGLLKVMAMYSVTQSCITIPNPAEPGTWVRFGLTNHNSYANASYREALSAKWSLFTAASLSYNRDDIRQGSVPARNRDWRAQYRGEVAYDASEAVHVVAGVEWQRFRYQQTYDTLQSGFQEHLWAAYAEAEWKPRRWLAVKPGVRAERSTLLDRQNVGPRLSLAVMTGDHSQVSAAGGLFFQNPGNRYLLAAGQPYLSTPAVTDLRFQKAMHYIANYQWMRDDRTFRVEAYYKDYQQLIREQAPSYDPNPYRYVWWEYNNAGTGYAQGIDFFWRDKASVKNLEYWLSYSLVDTKRLYENFPEAATPTFVSNHNLNVILKYYIESLKLFVGGSYNYSSGRPYYRPDSPDFLSDRTPDYHNLALNAAYLTTIDNFFTVFYLSFDNITNRKNIFGYRYANEGQERYAIQPLLYRSLFVGVNISLSAFNKDEL
ncbi:Outer membrane cobalamin receptor protein [Catalinimonas alkaloidigena]|uniref:Outer membrane cobalamin receptor protein n=1 Tax=Catalinimonas alkaloidigena TaxID=1075417 RepID=A0A1G9H2P1_9BACT|nr:TonB-dependent receptor [Catalinimonas alkaloidigena]SDL07064.1 Outer membrane cobalamin receptor protein [Catalinimonas alkaloidigena]